MPRASLILALAGALALAVTAAGARPKKAPAQVLQPAAPIVATPKAPPPPAVPTLATLVSTSEKDVKDRLGVPDMARREGQFAMWTYAWPDCALMVFFKSPDGRTLKVSGASAGPRHRGQTAPSVDACLAQNHGRPAKPDENAIDALLDGPH